jgi:YD repeat-containing protein
MYAINCIQHSEDASGRVTYTFDADGNRQVVEQPNGDRTTNVWDYENRLTATQKAGGTNVTMTYTPDNRRVTREEAVE